jgi:hypothetical protein
MRPADLRQFPVAGGIATWPIPVVTGLLSLGALGLEAFDVALGVALLGFVAQKLWRGGVIETSDVGLTRGFVLSGRFAGRATVMRWDTVTDIHTRWRHPGDDTALLTFVRDADGRTIRLSTAMGLQSYWRCLDSIAARAPRATRSGLTDAVLAEGPPGRRGLLSAAATAGALALVVVAVVGVHYLWAQGRSSFARQLEQAAQTPPPSPALRPRRVRRGSAPGARARLQPEQLGERPDAPRP